MRTVLLLTDFSKKAEHAAGYALKIASKAEAQVLIFNVCVVPELVPIASTLVMDGREAANIQDESLDKLRELAGSLESREYPEAANGFKPRILYKCVPGTIAENIKEIVEKEDIWLIVMGTKGESGISNFLFGSNAYATIDNADCPVLLVPPQVDVNEIRKIGFASDLKTKSIRGIRFLSELAGVLKSEIVIAHVCQGTDLQDGNHDESRALLKELKMAFNSFNPTFKNIEGAEVDLKLEKFSETESIDILTLIHRKLNFFGRIFYSSTTKMLLKHSKIPLLVLPDNQ